MSRTVDDDSDIEGDDNLEWLLGFVDPPRNSTDLLRHKFPSKVGGRPAWLDPLHLPNASQLTCPKTNELMRFLMQVYAPVDENPQAFHRCIYLFISPDGSTLSQPGTVRALRCQLPRDNRFYPAQPPSHSDTTPPVLHKEQEQQSLLKDPWNVVLYEKIVTKTIAASTRSDESGNTLPPIQKSLLKMPPVFPENELVVEPEMIHDDVNGHDDTRINGTTNTNINTTLNEVQNMDKFDEKTKSLLLQYHQRNAKEGEYTEEELPSDVMDGIENNVTAEQQHFASFIARLGKEPAQVLRYCFDKDAVPLCPSPDGIPEAKNIPCCACCGGPRQFEFQVMPQLLNHLQVDAMDSLSPDWGTIVVYSCVSSCSDQRVSRSIQGNEVTSMYMEEYVWVQKSA